MPHLALSLSLSLSLLPTPHTTQVRDVGGAVCNGYFLVVGGDDGKTLFSTVNLFNTSSATGDKQKFTVPAPVKNAQVGCFGTEKGGFYFLVAGGSGGLKSAVHALNTMPGQLPAGGSPLAEALAATAQVAVASDEDTGAVMYFDGTHGDVFVPK
jgi:hypothetical protein